VAERKWICTVTVVFEVEAETEDEARNIVEEQMFNTNFIVWAPSGDDNTPIKCEPIDEEEG